MNLSFSAVSKKGRTDACCTYDEVRLSKKQYLEISLHFCIPLMFSKELTLSYQGNKTLFEICHKS